MYIQDTKEILRKLHARKTNIIFYFRLFDIRSDNFTLWCLLMKKIFAQWTKNE